MIFVCARSKHRVTCHTRFYFRLITPEEMMSCHGFESYDLSCGLSYTDKMGLVGRGMCASSLVLVLAPCLKALGHLQPA